MRRKPQRPGLAKTEHSIQLAWAAMLASHLALTRRHTKMGIDDYFGAIYLSDVESLARFWRKRDDLQIFASTACNLHEPPWFYWFQFCQDMREKKYGDGVFIACSSELANALGEARNLAHKSNRGNQARAVVGVGHFVLAAASRKTEFARRLLSSGLDLNVLRSIVG